MDHEVAAESTIVEDLDGDPLRTGGHTDLVGITVIAGADSVSADDSTHGVGAMAVVVARSGEKGLGEVGPVVVVVSWPTAVGGAQRRVGPLDTGVHVGHDDALAGDPKISPYLIGTNAGHIPDNPLRFRTALLYDWLGQAMDAVGTDALHLGAGGDGQGCVQISGHGQPVEDP